jgi:hypothetical protein
MVRKLYNRIDWGDPDTAECATFIGVVLFLAGVTVGVTEVLLTWIG